MQKLRIACVLLGIIVFRPVFAGVLVGVNTVNPNELSDQQQDQLIEDLHKAGVSTIRMALSDDKTIRIITRAFEHGIRAVVVIFPTLGSKNAHIRPANASAGLPWPQASFSSIDPEEFRAWFSDRLARLEAAGVRLSAFEFGNEINTAGYDGDFPARGSSRVLGMDDLDNPRDQEAAAITAGYRVYLKTLVELKKVRDGSKLNKTTPIISAGLADPGFAGPRSGLKQPLVSLTATITFLRENGIDDLVDGYGVHQYPVGNPKIPLSTRIENFDKRTFAPCTAKKPCWLTEWGFNNDTKSCPVDDGTRVQLVHTLRELFKHFAEQKRLAAVIYYAWNSDPYSNGVDPLSIYRCGGLTESGKLALSPM